MLDLLDYGINNELALFSILVNKAPTGLIQPSIGIKQADPLFLFLFILIVKGIGRIIK